MKTRVEQLITGYFRVHWKDGQYRGGYRDFPTLDEANNYKTILDTQDLINSQQEGYNSIMKHLEL